MQCVPIPGQGGSHQDRQCGIERPIEEQPQPLLFECVPGKGNSHIDGKRVQLTDHSVFIAFAPKDDPKIALAVFVENGYWGSRWAGRIASLMIEKYIKGSITRTDLEDFILNGSLQEEYEKPYSGQPFTINQ